MIGFWNRQRFSSRALIRYAIACLLILQALGVGGSLGPRFLAAGSDAVLSSIGERCDPSDHSSPAPIRHDHSQCCILCSSAGGDGRLLPLAILSFVITFFPEPRNVSTIEYSPELSVKRLIGWASSWSSRAPPIFS